MGCERGQIKSGESLLGNLCWRYYGGWWAWCLDAGDAGPTASVLHVSVWGGHGGARGASKSRRRMRRTRCIKRSMWVSCYNDVRFKVERIIRFLRLYKIANGRTLGSSRNVRRSLENFNGWPFVLDLTCAILLRWFKDDSPTSCLCIGSV